MRPNVVVLLLDTARADAFEPYGAPHGASPVIADLASAGIAVPDAYAPSNWTIPSHASMFTGLLPLSLGLGQLTGSWGVQCRSVLEANRDRLLPEVFREAGYATAAVSANAWISPRCGFALGFDEFRLARGRRYEGIAEPGVKSRLRWARQALRARIDDGAAVAAAIIDEWLDTWTASTDDQPFFLFVNLVECHSPYLPPLPYNTLSPWKRVLAGEEARRHLTLEELWKINAGGYDVSDAAIGRMRTLYGDSIRVMDDWVGRLIEGLDARNLLDDTVLAVTSDHGEHLGENRLLGHAMSLSDHLIRVPLVLHGPGVTSVQHGDRPVSLVDLPAVLADAVGMVDHPWSIDEHPAGAAVAQYDGPMRSEPQSAVTFASTHGLGAEAVRRLTSREICATDGAHKLLRHENGAELLFDLTDDSSEGAPTRPNVDPAVVDRLRRAIDQSEEASAHASPSVAVDDDPSELDELEGQLRLLGYL